jgi:hypothetical protein
MVTAPVLQGLECAGGLRHSLRAEEAVLDWTHHGRQNLPIDIVEEVYQQQQDQRSPCAGK